MNHKKLKEIFITILLAVIIMFMLIVLFYDSISSNNQKLVSIEYIQDEDVVKTLEEIHSNTETDVKSDDSSSLLKSYSISQNDLASYASESSYESGKDNPFDEYTNQAEPILEPQNSEKTNTTQANKNSR